MKWNRTEIDRLYPILEQISGDLSPVDGQEVLVLCSATGEVAFWLGEMMETGRVVGLELDTESLEIARRSAHEMGLEAIVSLQAAEKDHIQLPDESFDSLVSEFIVYPTSTPTEIGHDEMARLLKPGGRMILTDVIVTKPLPPDVRQVLANIGLEYLCEGSLDDFRSWMTTAGLVKIEVTDLSSTLRGVWETRRMSDRAISHRAGYEILLDDPVFRLGKGIFYIYVRGEKPLDHS